MRNYPQRISWQDSASLPAIMAYRTMDVWPIAFIFGKAVPRPFSPPLATNSNEHHKLMRLQRSIVGRLEPARHFARSPIRYIMGAIPANTLLSGMR